MFVWVFLEASAHRFVPPNFSHFAPTVFQNAKTGAESRLFTLGLLKPTDDLQRGSCGLTAARPQQTCSSAARERKTNLF